MEDDATKIVKGWVGCKAEVVMSTWRRQVATNRLTKIGSLLLCELAASLPL